MLQNYDEIKNFLSRKLATNAPTDTFIIGDVTYKCVKLNAHDEYRLLRNLSFKTVKSVLPILKPLINGFNQLQTADLSTMQVEELLDTPIYGEAIEALDKINQDDLNWIMDLSYLCIAKADKSTPLDLDVLLEENPNHLYILVYKFLEVQVGRLFMGKQKDGKKKPTEKQQMKLG